jgi:para-nitrobenzyl esterase
LSWSGGAAALPGPSRCSRTTKGRGSSSQAAAPYGLIGRLPFGPIMGLDPLPPASETDDRLADAARRVELLVGYTRNDGAPFVAMDPRIARMKRLGPVGAVIERAASAALTRRVFGTPARRLAEAWRGHGGRSATYRVDWSPPRAPLGACHCIELPLLFDAPAWTDAPMLGGGRVDDRLAETMRRNWSGFAHHGVAALDSPALRFG